MASVLGAPVSAGFAPQNLDAPVPSTTASASPSLPPSGPSRASRLPARPKRISRPTTRSTQSLKRPMARATSLRSGK